LRSQLCILSRMCSRNHIPWLVSHLRPSIHLLESNPVVPSSCKCAVNGILVKWLPLGLMQRRTRYTELGKSRLFTCFLGTTLTMQTMLGIVK
jgi:hypothetical protein